MRNKEFTPGPWQKRYRGTRSDANQGRDFYKINTAESVDIDDVAVAHTFGRSKEANANLIAAAPELYEALENIMELFDAPVALRKRGSSGVPSWIIQARAALKKARGES